MTALFPGITLIGVARPTYLKSGRMMPENDFGWLRSFDAIYLGAVGYPGVPDHAYISVLTWWLNAKNPAQRYRCSVSTSGPAVPRLDQTLLGANPQSV
jgi:hypothetical protein